MLRSMAVQLVTEDWPEFFSDTTFPIRWGLGNNLSTFRTPSAPALPRDVRDSNIDRVPRAGMMRLLDRPSDLPVCEVRDSNE